MLFEGLAQAFWIALVASAVMAYPTYRLLLSLKSRQTVSQYAPEGHQAKQGTPTMGGIIIVIGVSVGLLFGPRSGYLDGPGWSRNTLFVGGSQLSFTLLLFLAFAAIGFIDDFLVPRLIKGKRGLGWKQKIVLELMAALLAIPALELPVNLTFIAVTVFVILFFSNAYNFSDGLDGLSSLLALSLFGGLGVLAFISGAQNAAICAAVVGAILPFLLLNAPPARMFMGDVGSLPIGALLGLEVCRLFLPPGGPSSGQAPLAITIPNLAALATLSLVMIAELVPVPLQIFWVKVFKKRIFPYTPIHHAFEKAGWPETRVVFMFAIAQALCVAGAISMLIWLPPGAQ